MPEMNGYEATRGIRLLENGKTVPIVAVTAGIVKGEKEKCIEVGMSDFIAKPIVENMIKVVFNKWVIPVKENQTMMVNIELTDEDLREHIDLEKLKAIVGEDDAILQVFLNSTVTELQKSGNDLDNSFQQKDLQALKKGGHKLKGSALAASLDKLSVLAKVIDELEVFDETYVSGLLTATRKEIETILQIIEKRMLR